MGQWMGWRDRQAGSRYTLSLAAGHAPLIPYSAVGAGIIGRWLVRSLALTMACARKDAAAVLGNKSIRSGKLWAEAISRLFSTYIHTSMESSSWVKYN